LMLHVIWKHTLYVYSTHYCTVGNANVLIRFLQNNIILNTCRELVNAAVYNFIILAYYFFILRNKLTYIPTY